MLFTELRFLPFFLLVFGVHWLLRSHGARKLWLLAASYAFYAFCGWKLLGLILASTVVDYVVGLRLVRPGARRRFWVTVSVGFNLGLLAVFKYLGFFVESVAEVLRWGGFELHLPTLAIVLPVGISFYTFQTLSYSLDVYAGRLAPTRKLLDLALFVAFFPQLVAGPIVRAADFLPQLSVPRFFARVEVRAALTLLFFGFVKKACISDNLAPLVDAVYAAPERFDALSVWLATLAYATQIYCDFSGYSDMAIACAALLGYRLRLNFYFPYFAGDITDFWRRWHISLSSWLRDYLYIPLGGSRGTAFARYRNLLVTMLLGGLWHGAAWTFVVWGGLHGLALIVHRLWRSSSIARGMLGRAVSAAGPLLTFLFVCLCWIFFRAQSFEDALTLTRAFVLWDAAGDAVHARALLWVLPLLLVGHVLARRRVFAPAWERLPAWGFGAGYGLLVAVALAFVATDPQPFIYFRF